MHTIGVLDSGIGGLTTIFSIFKHNPQLNIIFYADNLNAPYGTKTAEEVYTAVSKGIDFLLSRKSEAIVLACNTATAVCINSLRRKYTVPFIGIEPAVKPAKTAHGDTLYLATPLTLKTKGNAGFQTQNTDFLATLIENFVLSESKMEELTKSLIIPKFDNVILGCTHYSYLTPYIKKQYPSITVFDGNEGVARQVKRMLNLSISPKKGKLFLSFSGRNEFAKYNKAFNSLN